MLSKGPHPAREKYKGRMRFDELPEILTPRDLIEYLPIGRDGVYSALKEQRIRNIRLGQKIIIPKAALREFYSRDFIPSMPPDTTLTPISRTVGTDQLVDEMIFSFTHTQEMPWMLPGIAPTLRRVEVALVVIVHFRDGKLAHEHIYWDQASVLKQIGLLTDPALPVCGVEAARKVASGR